MDHWRAFLETSKLMYSRTGRDVVGFEWDDLRYVLAVANAGSLAGAARSLGVNHTTVLRRIGAFEKRLGLRLFERLPTGYVLTAGGEELIAEARHIEDRVTNLERKLAGRDLRLSGGHSRHDHQHAYGFDTAGNSGGVSCSSAWNWHRNRRYKHFQGPLYELKSEHENDAPACALHHFDIQLR